MYIKVEVPESIKEKNPEVVSSLCHGCLKEATCYPYGYRKSGNFCSEGREFIAQLQADSSCDNSFECSSNVCVSGKCISESFIEKMFGWFKKLFGG